MIATVTHLTGSRRGQCATFSDELITIGRASNNRLSFGDTERRVSSHHAQITRHGDGYLIRDLGSTNGTMLNGRRIIISELGKDDLIEFGAGGPLIRFSFESPDNFHDKPTKPLDNLPKAKTTIAEKPLTRRDEITNVFKRFIKQRKNNVRLTTAIMMSLLLGAFLGIRLSQRFSSPESDRLNFAAIAKRNSDAVVFVQTEFELVDPQGNVTMIESRTGSGFIITPNGLIVTNRHLVHPWEYEENPAGISGRLKRLSVLLQGRKRDEAIPASLAYLSVEKDTDIAILRITPPPDMTVVFGLEPNLSQVNQGDEVAAIGYPLGISLLVQTTDERIETSLATGVVSRVGDNKIQLDLHAYHGNSGCPVFNLRGEVIGIVTATIQGAKDLIICQPVGVIHELIKDESRHFPERQSSKGYY
ncbi:MAG: trypsin-like peptidase domain-containing protein [Acidobacteriota bacterium]